MLGAELELTPNIRGIKRPFAKKKKSKLKLENKDQQQKQKR